MENLVSPEILVSLVGGGVIAVLVGLLKGPLKKYSPRLVVAVISALGGLAYYLFYSFVPELLQQEFLNFFYGTFSSAVFLYAFLWKGLKADPTKAKKK